MMLEQPPPHSQTLHFSVAHAAVNTPLNPLLWFTQVVKVRAPWDSQPGTNYEVGTFLFIPHPDKEDTAISWNSWLLIPAKALFLGGPGYLQAIEGSYIALYFLWALSLQPFSVHGWFFF